MLNQIDVFKKSGKLKRIRIDTEPKEPSGVGEQKIYEAKGDRKAGTEEQVIEFEEDYFEIIGNRAQARRLCHRQLLRTQDGQA